MKSMAASLPPSQPGRKTSAGLQSLPGNIHAKNEGAGDILPANFWDVIGFSAKFRDFIRIFKKAISTISLVFRMYAESQNILWWSLGSLQKIVPFRRVLTLSFFMTFFVGVFQKWSKMTKNS